MKNKVKLVLNIFKILLVLFAFFWFKDKVNTNEYIKKIINKTEEKLLNEDELVYLALDDTYKININNKSVSFMSSDENIAVVENGVLIPKNIGTVTITAYLKKKKQTIIFDISDLYIKATINNKKNILPCNHYSKEENDYLDNILSYKINKAGYQTRAGALAAARFLSLEFKYRIPYFYENGRLLTNGERSYADGEGRYYHKGLYLSESKYSELVASIYGPKMWGCNMYTKTLKIKSPNVLDCSGFVSWLLYNAGFDIGDAGAGISESNKNDLDDLGEKISINPTNLSEQKFKVGDLLSRYGHIGILIGIDNEKYYVAEALDYDLHVNIYTEKELLDSDWLYFILLDNLYKEDGNLTSMW